MYVEIFYKNEWVCAEVGAKNVGRTIGTFAIFSSWQLWGIVHGWRCAANSMAKIPVHYREISASQWTAAGKWYYNLSLRRAGTVDGILHLDWLLFAGFIIIIGQGRRNDSNVEEQSLRRCHILKSKLTFNVLGVMVFALQWKNNSVLSHIELK